jgi:hypothetical protein
MLSTENAAAKSLAPVITSGSALNSVSIQLMKSGKAYISRKWSRTNAKSLQRLLIFLE